MNNHSVFPSQSDTSIADKSLVCIYSYPESFSEIWVRVGNSDNRAFKCLKEEYRGIPVYEERLKKEFETGSSLSHTGICKYFSFGEIEGLGNVIEMEWYEGMSLAEALYCRIIKPTKAELIAAQLCDLLTYLQSKQIFIEELNPSNLFLTKDRSKVRLINYNLDDILSNPEKAFSASSKAYVAPEVIAGSKADIRSAIYSLGMVLYQMNIQGSAKVLSKCCELDPAKRYQSVEQVRLSLEEATSSWKVIVPGIAFILLAVIGVLFSIQ